MRCEKFVGHVSEIAVLQIGFVRLAFRGIRDSLNSSPQKSAADRKNALLPTRKGPAGEKDCRDRGVLGAESAQVFRYEANFF